MDEACLAEGAALEHRLAWLEEQQASNRALRELLATRAECLLRKGDLAAHEAAEQAKQDEAALSRAVAGLEFDLTKSKVDLMRWRQRSALLKVQLSSAEEDAKRYQRVGAILQQQCALEQRAKLAAQDRATARLKQAAEASAQRAAAARADLEATSADLAEVARQLGRLQQELAAAAQTKAELEGRLSEARREHASQQQTAEVGQGALQQELGRLRAVNAQLEKQHADAEAAARQQQAELQRANQQLQQQAGKAEAQAMSQGLEIASLQARLAAEEKLVEELRAQLSEKRSRISELEEGMAARNVTAFVSQLESPAPAMEPKADETYAAAQRNVQAAVAPAEVPSDRDAKAPAEEHKKAAARGRGKRKKQGEDVDAPAAGSLREADASGKGEEAAAGRPRRDRSKAQPYWMGPQQGDADTAAAEQPEPQPQNSLADLADAAELAAGGGGTLPEAEAAVDAADAEEAPVEQPAAEAGKGRKRSRQLKAQLEQPSLEGGSQAAEGAAPDEAKAQKGRGRKQQLKRPQGEIKTNLTSVWGGATPVPAASEVTTEQGPRAAKAARTSNLAPKAAAAQQDAKPVMDEDASAAASLQHAAVLEGRAANDENHAASKQPARGPHASAPASQQQEQLEVSSRTYERPLGALNQRTLEAAANRVNRPTGALKSSLQKAIAARGEQAQQQPNKRRLMPVSSSYAAATAASAGALPTSALFGGQFKVPRLMK